MIRLAVEQDIQRLEEIHRSALKDDLLPRLGSDFLRKVFFHTAIKSPYSFTLIYVDNNNIPQSFVIFTYNSRLFTKNLYNYKLFIIKAIIKQFTQDKTLIKDLLVSLFLARKVIHKSLVTSIDKIPELYLIATHPNQQNRNFGSEIVKEGLLRLKKMGYTQCLVKTSSDKAKKFYQRIGFYQIGEEFRGNRFFSVLLIDF